MRALAFALVVACTPVPQPDPQPNPPKPVPTQPDIPDSGPPPYPVEEVSCESACQNQRDNGCRVGAPTAKGAPCEEVCANAMAGPVAMRWDLACLTTATTCSAC